MNSSGDRSNRHAPGTQKLLFRASAKQFKKIPGSPIAYWIPSFDIFDLKKISADHFSGGRVKTHDGEKYIRFLWEPSRRSPKWKRLVKGGDFRKYSGNESFLIDWSSEAIEFYESLGGIYPERFRGKDGICWSKISSSSQSFRVKRAATEFDSASPTLFSQEFSTSTYLLSLLNSPVSRFLLQAINPTMNTQVADVLALPVCEVAKSQKKQIELNTTRLINIHSGDWDEQETAWEFSSHPLLHNSPKIAEAYKALYNRWLGMRLEVQQLEEENNHAFIEAYGLQDELRAQVLPKEVTLTCNPHYRYGGNKTEEELQALLLADTIREFISYAVGCMFGRYSLNKPGLVLANQGETLTDYLRHVPQPTFTPDADNVIPLLDGEWFNDDITERFRSFLRLTFGEAHYVQNLKFIEDALGKDIRRFFLRDFYNDHVKRYKKRPIYWLFSSPKGSFNALIYLHRYRPDTVSVVLQYLRDFQEKLAGERKRQEQISISASASQAEKTRALKGIDSLKKTLAELDDYEREVLHPLATQQIDIDLDDGVKVNYVKFGKALKAIPGLAAKEGD